ncbi:phosphomannomutase/phosphoglucomutase, partial [Neisseria sp. P0001.S004]
LRVEFPDGFGLMRASNTTPILVLRFEADTQEAIERIQNQFKAVIESNPALKWPL